MRKIHVHADQDLAQIRKTIELKEQMGKDASGEKELYRAWIKEPEYARADARNIQGRVYKALKN